MYLAAKFPKRIGSYNKRRFGNLSDAVMVWEPATGSYDSVQSSQFEGNLWDGYAVNRFSFDGKYYLRMLTDREYIIPRYDGFREIKGSEFYLAKEKYLEKES